MRSFIEILFSITNYMMRICSYLNLHSIVEYILTLIKYSLTNSFQFVHSASSQEEKRKIESKFSDMEAELEEERNAAEEAEDKSRKLQAQVSIILFNLSGITLLILYLFICITFHHSYFEVLTVLLSYNVNIR